MRDDYRRLERTAVLGLAGSWCGLGVIIGDETNDDKCWRSCRGGERTMQTAICPERGNWEANPGAQRVNWQQSVLI